MHDTSSLRYNTYSPHGFSGFLPHVSGKQFFRLTLDHVSSTCFSGLVFRNKTMPGFFRLLFWHRSLENPESGYDQISLDIKVRILHVSERILLESWRMLARFLMVVLQCHFSGRGFSRGLHDSPLSTRLPYHLYSLQFFRCSPCLPWQRWLIHVRWPPYPRFKAVLRAYLKV